MMATYGLVRAQADAACPAWGANFEDSAAVQYSSLKVSE